MPESEHALLDVQNLAIDFHSHGHTVNAVKGISFKVSESSTVAIVGESGSGKSVTALSLTRLLPEEPLCEVHGKINYKGRDVMQMGSRELRKLRGKEIAFVFQDPSTSLNPVFTVGNQIGEAVKLHLPEIKDVKQHVIEALHKVGIRNPAERYSSYPHELSGGMQQRVMIAMALACHPKILVADEPTTALDVTIQKQIMDLLREIKKTESMSIILITHNFGIIKDFADEVLVMFRGEIVERGKTEDVLYHPQHPYTQALIECIPRLGQEKKRLTTIDYKKILKTV